MLVKDKNWKKGGPVGRGIKHYITCVFVEVLSCVHKGAHAGMLQLRGWDWWPNRWGQGLGLVAKYREHLHGGAASAQPSDTRLTRIQPLCFSVHCALLHGVIHDGLLRGLQLLDGGGQQHNGHYEDE
jgi:hypothetical protein